MWRSFKSDYTVLQLEQRFDFEDEWLKAGNRQRLERAAPAGYAVEFFIQPAPIVAALLAIGEAVSLDDFEYLFAHKPINRKPRSRNAMKYGTDRDGYSSVVKQCRPI